MTSTSYITVTDQFCGAGGSSLGAASAGAEIKLALNHWKLAVETHNTNFPNTDHDCTDVSAVDPRRYRSTDILITSPECTNHSLAKGKIRKWQAQADMFGWAAVDPSEERSRATMWDVCRFAEAHHYNIVIVENVVEARHWAPFEAWLMAMRLLGYDHQIVYLNSMHAHPTPQSRDRMYMVFWKKTLRRPDLDIRPRAYCGRCQGDVDSVQSWKNARKPWGKYAAQYVYRCPQCASEVTPYYYAAMNAIDWALPAPRIGDRNRPLKEKTLKRIRVGLEKFGRQPILVDLAYTHGHDRRSTGIDDAAPTQTGRQTEALIVPPYLVDLRGENAPKALDDVLSTVCGSGNHHGLVYPPFLTSFYGSMQHSTLDEAVPTQPSIDKHALVVPPFLVSYYTRSSGDGAALSEVTEAAPTVPGWAVHYLAQPGETPAVEDCGFRMLQPHEIGAAMAFPSTYTVLGNQRQKVKQYGNAVTPPVMQMLIERCLAVLH
jgi:DNA (cytosine-5)-methyltransferase 1